MTDSTLWMCLFDRPRRPWWSLTCPCGWSRVLERSADRSDMAEALLLKHAGDCRVGAGLPILRGPRPRPPVTPSPADTDPLGSRPRGTAK